MHWLAVWAVVGAAVCGCKERLQAAPRVDAALPVDATRPLDATPQVDESAQGDSPRITKLVEQIQSSDHKVAIAGMYELAKLRFHTALTLPEQLQLIRVARRLSDENRAPPGAIQNLLAALRSPPLGKLSTREELLDALRPAIAGFRGEVRSEAIEVIAEIDSPAAIAELILDFKKYGKDTSMIGPLLSLAKHPHHADVAVPGLFEVADAEGFLVYDTLTAYCRAHQFPAAAVSRQLAEHARKLGDELGWLALQRSIDARAMWSDDEYGAHRQIAASLLDLFGCAPAAGVSKLLASAVAQRDLEVVRHAAVAQLDRGVVPPPGLIARLAADPTERGELYAALRDRKRLDLFPPRLGTQLALAASDLAHWLALSDVEWPPSAIELGKRFTLPGRDAPREDYYVFRFRLAPPHPASKDGWLAGLAGPYPEGGPVSVHGNKTTSKLIKWSAKTPEQHLRDLLEIE